MGAIANRFRRLTGSERYQQERLWGSELTAVFLVAAACAFVMSPALGMIFRTERVSLALPWYAVTVEAFSIVSTAVAAFLAWARFTNLRLWSDHGLVIALATYTIIDAVYLLAFPGLIGQSAILAQDPNTSAVEYLIKFVAFAAILWVAILPGGAIMYVPTSRDAGRQAGKGSRTRG